MERCQSGRPDSYREGQSGRTPKNGEMPEWSIGAVSKTVDLARGPRVRIPISPQSILNNPLYRWVFFIQNIFINKLCSLNNYSFEFKLH